MRPMTEKLGFAPALTVMALLTGCSMTPDRYLAPLNTEDWVGVAHATPMVEDDRKESDAAVLPMMPVSVEDSMSPVQRLTPLDREDRVGVHPTPMPHYAQEEDEEDLARKAQNPIGAYWNIPFENNFNFGAGAHNKLQYTMQFQPVIPVPLNDNWNLITRTLMPVVSQPALVAGQDRKDGLGDTTLSLFFVPKKVPFVLGFGPALLLPTRTDKRLGAGRFGMGPAVVALTMQGPWVVGGLVQYVKDVGGSSRPDVSQMLLQPIINYNLEDGWYLTSNSAHTADFEAKSGEKWTVPLGGGIGKVHVFGNQPVNMRLQAFYNVHHPDLVGNWTLQFRIQLMF